MTATGLLLAMLMMASQCGMMKLGVGDRLEEEELAGGRAGRAWCSGEARGAAPSSASRAAGRAQAGLVVDEHQQGRGIVAVHPLDADRQAGGG
jgi:hypothetical protein